MAPAAPDGGAESQRQADLLKQEGNAFFRKERLSAAIDAYTGAITLCPNVTVYWTNRALCYRKRNEWAKVEEDCRTAIQLDSQSVKGVPASVLIVSCNKDTQNQVVARRSFFRCSTVQLHWNKGSTGLLVLAQADVDKTNCQLLHYVNLSTVWDVAELG